MISRRAFLAGAATSPAWIALAACSADNPPRTLPQPRAYLRTHWQSDPWSRGAVSYLPLGATERDRAVLAAPVDGQLFFAGEATSQAHPATVRGAVESGRRAASEVLATRPATGANVVVLGAGAAGLAAAAELRTAGINALVIDARERIGGRVFTDTSLGTPVDLGAAWLQPADDTNPLVALARQANVTLDAIESPIVHRRADGRVVNDHAAVRERFAAALAAVGTTGASASELDEALRAEANRGQLRDPALRALMTTEIDNVIGAPATQISWDGFQAGSPARGVRALPRGGYGALMSELARGANLRLGTPVASVEWSRARNQLVLGDGSTVPFDQLVLTVPLGALQAGSPTFAPLLPATKSAAIAKLGVGFIECLALRFDDVFWDRDAVQIGFDGITVGEWVTWRNLYPTTGAPILVGVNGALIAQRNDLRSDEQLVTSAMSALRTMYA